MKNLKLSLIALVMMISFAACDSEDAINPDQNQQEQNDTKNVDNNDGDDSDNGEDTDGGDNGDGGDTDGGNGDGGDNGDGGNGDGNTAIDCSTFKGVIEFAHRGYTFAGVQTLSIRDIDASDPDAVKWTINGRQVRPENNNILPLHKYLSTAAVVEVCFEAISPTCGTLSDCTTIDFKPKK